MHRQVALRKVATTRGGAGRFAGLAEPRRPILPHRRVLRSQSHGAGGKAPGRGLWGSVVAEYHGGLGDLEGAHQVGPEAQGPASADSRRQLGRAGHPPPPTRHSTASRARSRCCWRSCRSHGWCCITSRERRTWRPTGCHGRTSVPPAAASQRTCGTRSTTSSARSQRSTSRWRRRGRWTIRAACRRKGWESSSAFDDRAQR